MTAVTRIEGHRTHKKQKELFVRERGFETTWCTWVFEANLQADVSAGGLVRGLVLGHAFAFHRASVISYARFEGG